MSGTSHTRPDADTLEELYHDEDMNQREIGEQYAVSQTTVSRWMNEGNVKTRRDNITKPDIDTLEELYHTRQMSQREIAEQYNVSQGTVQNWMSKENIKTRESSPQPPTWKYKYNNGYTYLTAQRKELAIHCLNAIAEFGIDAIRGKHVHHIDENTWNNSRDNLALLTRREHRKLHKNDNYELNESRDGIVRVE